MKMKSLTIGRLAREARVNLVFGTDWPEIAEKKEISVPNLSQEQEGLPDVTQEALVNQ